jgi:hypothetical protein
MGVEGGREDPTEIAVGYAGKGLDRENCAVAGIGCEFQKKDNGGKRTTNEGDGGDLHVQRAS